MAKFDGYLFSKLSAIGSRSEGPAYYLQFFDATEVAVIKKTQAWEADPELHPLLATKVTLSGKLQVGKIRYDSAAPYKKPGAAKSVRPEVKVTLAEWNLRPRTKFLKVEGYVTVSAPTDKVTAKLNTAPGGLNVKIALVDVVVTPGGGPAKSLRAPFRLMCRTKGTEPWNQVQARCGDASDTLKIKRIE